MEKPSKTSIFQSFKKSQALLLLLALLLDSSLYVHSLDFSVTFEASSTQRGRALLKIDPTNKQSSTMKIHHEEQTHKNPTTGSPATAAIAGTDASAAAAARKDRQFGMAAHEVPSGPNPESNR